MAARFGDKDLAAIASQFHIRLPLYLIVLGTCLPRLPSLLRTLVQDVFNVFGYFPVTLGGCVTQFTRRTSVLHQPCRPPLSRHRCAHRTKIWRVHPHGGV